MLKKEFRLTSVMLDNPISIETPYFKLRTASNNLKINRFAFVVSKRIDKKAVTRNRLKRKLRTGIEEIFDRIKKGNDFVFYPKQKVKDEEQSIIVKDLVDALSKKGLI